MCTGAGDGRVWGRGLVPRYYPMPAAGPGAALLGATGRHPNRPAHVHFMAGAEGCSPVTTQVCVEGSPYLDSDAVFGVKPSLVRAVRTETDADLAASYDMTAPFALLEFDLVLDRE